MSSSLTDSPPSLRHSLSVVYTSPPSDTVVPAMSQTRSLIEGQRKAGLPTLVAFARARRALHGATLPGELARVERVRRNMDGTTACCRQARGSLQPPRNLGERSVDL